ncbi:MAG: hypothetical protein A4E53_00165 [Pelotomaculum sp. PtaB.Bin104]|nr:MAG: hypothetical protein A4E53_00165 [Pelotomaculum sp. PtaB.Bin104]OPY60710.1 MAG: hypothetical protein A4E56_02513 [Pelotomaculum sp. PtaU1.Bin065]
MTKKINNKENNRFILNTAVGVFITWLLILVFIDIIMSLHHKSGLEMLEGILFFNAILFFLGLCWVIYITIYLLKSTVPVSKREFSKDSATIKITK